MDGVLNNYISMALWREYKKLPAPMIPSRIMPERLVKSFWIVNLGVNVGEQVDWSRDIISADAKWIVRRARNEQPTEQQPEA